MRWCWAEAARAAYQVGVLRGIAARFPHFRAPLLTGVSAGAINVAHLANHVGAWSHKIEDLMGLWRRLDFDDVFRVDTVAVVWRVMRIGLRLSVGLPPGVARAQHGRHAAAPRVLAAQPGQR